MKPAVWLVGVVMVLCLSVPFGASLIVTTVTAPAAVLQLAVDPCGEAGSVESPTPTPLPADCVPVGGPLPPGPEGSCPPSGSTAERGLKANALRGLRCVKQRFGWIRHMGGVGRRPSGYVSDHPAGRAVDFMIPSWNTNTGNARGWEVAHWLQKHAKDLRVKYLIYDDRSWRAYNPSAGWRPYRYPGPNRGGSTQRHLDHVHASFYP